LQAAERLFTEHGFAAVTMQSIASAAGVSLATLSLYFPRKPAVVAAIAEAVTASPQLSVEHVEQKPDAVSLLRVGASIIRQLNDRSWAIADILRSAQGADESLSLEWKLCVNATFTRSSGRQRRWKPMTRCEMAWERTRLLTSSMLLRAPKCTGGSSTTAAGTPTNT